MNPLDLKCRNFSQPDGREHSRQSKVELPLISIITNIINKYNKYNKNVGNMARKYSINFTKEITKIRKLLNRKRRHAIKIMLRKTQDETRIPNYRKTEGWESW